MARLQEFDTTEVLHKAMALFWQQGYEATSLADLLNVMGLSKSSLYATFGSKYALFIAAFDAYRAARKREAAYLLNLPDARQAIERFFMQVICDIGVDQGPRGCMGINQAIEMAPRQPEIKARIMEDFAGLEALLVATIERGQQQQSINAAVVAPAVAKCLIIAFPGLQIRARAGYSHAELEQELSLLLRQLSL